MSTQLCTPAQVAKRLSISIRTVYSLLKEGALPRIKIGRSTRIRVSDVDTYIENGGYLVAEGGRGE